MPNRESEPTTPTNFRTKSSLWFIKNMRATLLLFLVFLTLGYLSYNQFLDRQDYPTVQLPLVDISVVYSVGDQTLVNKSITEPIEHVLLGLTEVKQFNSETSKDLSKILVELNDSINPDSAAKTIAQEIESQANLPEKIVITVKPQYIDRINDQYHIWLSIYPDPDQAGISISTMQNTAQKVVDQLNNSSLIDRAEMQKQIVEPSDNFDIKESGYQTKFNRVGIRAGDQLEFRDSVAIGVVGYEITSPADLSQEVHSIINKLSTQSILNGYSVNYIADPTHNINDSFNTLITTMFNSLILIGLVLLFFINWRASIIGTIFVSTVVGLTLTTLFVLGYDLNILVALSLITVLGLVVDDIIVLLEAVNNQYNKGYRGIEGITRAFNQIDTADFSGTVTTALVFLPMVFTVGILGEFIHLVPITIIISLLISIVLIFTMAPALPYLLNIPTPLSYFKDLRALNLLFELLINKPGQIMDRLGKFLGNVFVRGYLKHPFINFFILIISLSLVTIGGSFISQLEFSIFPNLKETNTIEMQIKFPNNSTIDQSILIAKDIEKVVTLLAGAQIKDVGYYDATAKQANIRINLLPHESRSITSATLVERLQNAFDQYEYFDAYVYQVIPGPPTTRYPFAIKVFSDNSIVLKNIQADLNTYLTNLSQNQVTQITDVVSSKSGTLLKQNGQSYTQVSLGLTEPRNTGLLLNLADTIKESYPDEKLDSFNLTSDDITYDLGFESNNIESFQSILYVMVISIVLIYIVLVIEFNSFLQPIIIFLAVPFSFTGLLPALYATDTHISFFTIIGVMTLVGIAVNNTILLMDAANRTQATGSTPRYAIVHAISLRFRPIVATTLTTVAVLIPLANQYPIWQGLVYALSFGLISSTTLVILFFPVYYIIIQRGRELKDVFISKERVRENVED